MNFSGPDPSPSALVNLTCSPSELEFITLVGYGLHDEEIAASMGSDQSTVQKLLKSLSDRLGAGDRYVNSAYTGFRHYTSQIDTKEEYNYGKTKSRPFDDGCILPGCTVVESKTVHLETD